MHAWFIGEGSNPCNYSPFYRRLQAAQTAKNERTEESARSMRESHAPIKGTPITVALSGTRSNCRCVAAQVRFCGIRLSKEAE